VKARAAVERVAAIAREDKLAKDNEELRAQLADFITSRSSIKSYAITTRLGTSTKKSVI